MPRFPLIPTVVVLAACAIMVALGVWQLGRLEEKEALIARAEQAMQMSSEVEFPRSRSEAQESLYRRSTVNCEFVKDIASRSGRSDNGISGWIHVAGCLTEDRIVIPVVIGFSRQPESPAWNGGEVSGWIASGPRLVAATGLAGLATAAPPDPNDLPNNHLAYAVQWFFFAATALVIYVLALKRRQRG